MFANMLQEVGGRGIAVLVGMFIGSFTAWIVARRRRVRERQQVLAGDARDTIVIHQHLIESVPVTDAPGVSHTVTALRVRTLGQSELNRVVPNGHLAGILLERARKAHAHDTLISMDGAEGSYLLETLTNFVCDRVANSHFDHNTYVMTACCEPAELAHHQPITILLVRKTDLPLFEKWTEARSLQVEHGSDGPRILTLIEMSKRFRKEQEMFASMRAAGKRTGFLETMYVLDLALDQRCAALPVKPVPWGRYENVLKELDLEVG